jgi:hypothetical protein
MEHLSSGRQYALIVIVGLCLFLPVVMRALVFLKRLTNSAANAADRAAAGRQTNAGQAAGTHPSAQQTTPQRTAIATGAAAKEKDKLPDSMKQQLLLKLEPGERIIITESNLLVGPGKAAAQPYSFTYTIITKKDKSFYVTTLAGKKGPFDKVPADLLPDPKKGTGLPGNITALRDAGPEEQKAALKHIQIDFSGNNPRVFVDRRLITTLKQGQLPGNYIYDEASGKYAVVINSYDAQAKMHADLYTNTAMKLDPQTKGPVNLFVLPSTSSFYFVTTDDARQKTLWNMNGEPLLVFSDLVYATADKKNFVCFKFDAKDNNAFVCVTSRKDRWKLSPAITDYRKLRFSHDGSRWTAMTDEGLLFSDGASVRDAILPISHKEGDKTSLHFLMLNPEYEVIACSMDW